MYGGDALFCVISNNMYFNVANEFIAFSDISHNSMLSSSVKMVTYYSMRRYIHHEAPTSRRQLSNESCNSWSKDLVLLV